MKKAELTEVKNLNKDELIKKVTTLKGQLNDLVMDKNMNKLKDVKSVFKTRKELAVVLTVLRQKQLLEQLESSEETEKPKKKNRRKKE